MAPSRFVGAPISREGRRGVVIVLNWRDIECRVRFFGPQVGRGDKSGGSRLVASRDIECRVTLEEPISPQRFLCAHVTNDEK